MPGPLLQLVQLALLAVMTGVVFNLFEYGGLKSLAQARSIAFSRDWVRGALYLFTYALAAAAIAAAVFSEVALVRALAPILIFVFLTMDLGCRFVMGSNIGFSEVQTTLAESTFAGQFLSSHTVAAAKAALCAGVAAAAFFAGAHWTPIRFDVWWLLLLPLAGAMAYAVVWWTVAATDVYPSPIRLPVLLAYALLNSLKDVPRQPVAIAVSRDNWPRFVVLVLDESVTASYLSINGWSKQTTPYLESVADQFLNFGSTCAASNISAATNVILRSGLREDQLPDRKQLGLTQASIFQYAHAAGYRTCYLDGQYRPGVRGNFLTVHDLESIDEVYWAIADEPDNSKRYLRDRLLAERMLDRIADDVPTFLWINKYGAHFHFEQTYPAEARFFQPTMPAGRSISACTDEEIGNSYANALRWSVDGFFEMIAPRLDLSETVLLYTSDHGQSLQERHGASTHADRINPPTIQANVPMLAWGDLVRERFPDGVDAFRNRTGHFQLFPTLLAIMGFAESEVVERYGAPLWGPSPGRRVFLSGDVFGRGVVHLNEFDAVNDGDPSETDTFRPMHVK